MQTVGVIKNVKKKNKLKRKLVTEEIHLRTQTEFLLHLHQWLNAALSITGVSFVFSFLLRGIQHFSANSNTFIVMWCSSDDLNSQFLRCKLVDIVVRLLIVTI